MCLSLYKSAMEPGHNPLRYRSGILLLVLVCLTVVSCDSSKLEKTTAASPESEIKIQPESIATAPISPGSPVEAGLELFTQKISPGGKVLLLLKFQMSPGWHIYAMKGPSGSNVPLSLELHLPAGLKE